MLQEPFLRTSLDAAPGPRGAHREQRLPHVGRRANSHQLRQPAPGSGHISGLGLSKGVGEQIKDSESRGWAVFAVFLPPIVGSDLKIFFQFLFHSAVTWGSFFSA